MNCQSRLASTTSNEVGQPLDEFMRQGRIDLIAGHVIGCVEDEEGDFDGGADLNEMLQNHRRRRRPVIGRGGDDGGSAGTLRKTRERGGDAGAGVADMGDHRQLCPRVRRRI